MSWAAPQFDSSLELSHVCASTMAAIDVVFVLLLLFFLVMNFTVERVYCEGPLQSTDTRPFIKETIDFAQTANPLFLTNPEWLVKATCVSAYGLSVGYIVLLLITLTNSWYRFKSLVLLFLGAKLYAVSFYHLMEFTGSHPPQDLQAYACAEIPYGLGMAICLYKALSARAPGKAKRKAE